MTHPGSPGAQDARWVVAMPAVFVLIWSTGFVVARFGMPHAPPFSFLAWRYAFSILCFAAWIAWAKPAWPQGRDQWLHLGVTGVLMHAGYLGGVWAAVKGGMSAGTSALIVGLQPLLTALWLSRSGQAAQAQVSLRQWSGLGLGLLGLVMVVWRKLSLGEATATSIAFAVMALACITTGTLWQKRHVRPVDVRTANLIQFVAALVVTWPIALWEEEPVRWNVASMSAMAWSVLALSLGGSSLLMALIQRGAATRVTSLMYLVPPTTAVMAWMLFGEQLTPLVVFGMAATAVGVWLVVKSPVKSESLASGKP